MCDRAFVCITRAGARSDATLCNSKWLREQFLFPWSTMRPDVEFKVRLSRDVSQYLADIVYELHTKTYMVWIGRIYDEEPWDFGFHIKRRNWVGREREMPLPSSFTDGANTGTEPSGLFAKFHNVLVKSDLTVSNKVAVMRDQQKNTNTQFFFVSGDYGLTTGRPWGQRMNTLPTGVLCNEMCIRDRG